MSSQYAGHSSSGYHDSFKPGQPYTGELPPPHFTLGSNMHEGHSNMIHAFNFDMWVSSPQQANRIDKAAHVYTRLQGDQHHPAAPPMPLENLVGWRTSFPHLASMIDEGSGPDCDIILLEANLELMNDFPPSGSRLGIQLDLDFAHPTAGDVFMVGQMDNWTCSTHIFEDSQKMLETYHDLQKASSTKVKPLFESSWWAKLFTQLTQEKRMAEDSGQYHAADEHTRNFFRSLSAVQEIRATSDHSRRISNQYPGDQSKRMAMLLWKFRQTRPGEVGTTTWRRLVPPPDRTSTNSPRPVIDLPPLSVDSMLLNKPASQNLYQPPQPQDLLHQSTTSQAHWPMYQQSHDTTSNMFNSSGNYDFLNSISRGEDGFSDHRTSVTSVLDSFPSLQETSQAPSHMNGSADNAGVMMNMHDLSSYSHPNLASYNSLGGHESSSQHYLPSHTNGHDHTSVLNSIFGSGQSMDDMSSAHTSWTAHPATSIADGTGYGHLQYGTHSEHPSREPQHGGSGHGFDGSMLPDELMEKIVGGMSGSAQGGMHGAGPDVSSAYGDPTIEAV